MHNFPNILLWNAYFQHHLKLMYNVWTAVKQNLFKQQAIQNEF